MKTNREVLMHAVGMLEGLASSTHEDVGHYQDRAREVAAYLREHFFLDEKTPK